MPSSTTRVPQDSFFIISISLNSVLEKSQLVESRVWKPIVDTLTLTNPQLTSLLLEPVQNGFNSRTPIQIFLRSSNLGTNPLQFGLLASIENTEKMDITMANFAEAFGCIKIKGRGTRYKKDNLPIEFGRMGKVFHILGIGPIIRDHESAPKELNEFFQLISNRAKINRAPTSLTEHFSTQSDLSVYMDGSGFGKIVEENWPEDRWKELLPLLDPFFAKQFGINITSNIGSLKLSATDYSTSKIKNTPKVKEISMINSIPGDSPLVARFSIPGKKFQNNAIKAVEQILLMLSDGKINKDTILPGFNASPVELLSSPSGDFVFAGGYFKEKNNYLPNGQFLKSLKPILLLGIGIDNKWNLKQFLAGINSANSVRGLLNSNQLHLLERESQLWISSPDYLRELEANKPLQHLSKYRKKILNQYSFALDLDFVRANKSIRKNSFLNFSQLKILSVIDDLRKLSIHSNQNQIVANLKLVDDNKSAWEIVLGHLGQTLIDQANQSIFQAIAKNDIKSVMQSVQQGALINAADRFGHTPIHYAAYKGNPRIVDYLLNKGGNPNIQGRHKSTPLHSAAWGKNMQVLELLLEDGANVNARTDEGETPGMTAALRGEKEMLEILFALSADPHAKDIHGTNMLDLAAAGGHKKIVDLLKQMGVKNQNPLHVAAGLGDLKEVKKLLKQEKNINSRDPFGATPLIVAMVSGKEEIVDFLLSRNANPLISAKDGYTLIHAAAFSGKKSLVQKALSFNLDVNLRYGPDGITPVDVAEETGDALPYLRSLGGKTAWELGRVFKN
ncbi:MAG: hypothetical protein HOI70_11020 [Opitutae bacterium]|nr:hypothetical protein [Opitutae bacterium]